MMNDEPTRYGTLADSVAELRAAGPTCPHGHYIGPIGPDDICGACETEMWHDAMLSDARDALDRGELVEPGMFGPHVEEVGGFEHLQGLREHEQYLAIGGGEPWERWPEREPQPRPLF